MTDVCHRLQVSESLCVELVEYGIVSPVGPRPAEWTFDLEMLSSMQRAMRLHRDLELDWSGVALVTELLDEREQLRRENRILRRRLSRFVDDSLTE
ncbi:MAG: chaperone modulatory protein CbpM [Pseudomonadales bacterium]|nr:chaperone modulatory protein CbpM [Pseudomonadales bacterium]